MTRLGLHSRGVGAVAGVALCLCAAILTLRRSRPLPPPGSPGPGGLLEADPFHILHDAGRPGPQPDPAPGIPRAKVLAGGMLRNALVVPTTSRFTIQTEIRGLSYLEIGAALVRDAADVRRPGVTFTVNAVLAKGGRRKLFARYIDPWYNYADRNWVDARVGLSREAQAVALEFETATESTTPPAGPEYAAWSFPRLLAPRAHGRPNVILVSIDTLRADRLGCYGYSLRPTSPSLDRLANQGVRFAHAYAQAPWTTPSHASMLTGLYVSRHGVAQDAQWIDRLVKEKALVRILHRATPTLAASLREAGYDTAAFTGGATVAAGLGFARGFDNVREDFAALGDEHRSMLRDWIASRVGRPFFLFLHTFEVHAPYLHGQFAAVPPDRTGAFRDLLVNHGDANFFFQGLQSLGMARPEVTSALYDGGVRHVDDFLGRFLQDLEGLGQQDETIVIVTSDHGEEFGDHSPERFYNAHGTPMYDELLAVPLIVRFPPRIPAGTVIRHPVRSIDIAPTVLDLVGLDPADDLDGRSLAPIWERRAASGRPPSIMSEASAGPVELKSLRRGRFKYIAATTGPAWTDNTLAEGGDELFDLELDPLERRNLVGQKPEVAASLRQELWTLVERARRSRPPVASTQVREPDLHERLRALGYVR